MIPNIKNIVYLMLENRSLDNVLGWLYERESPANFIPSNSTPIYDGLQTGDYSNPDGNGNQIPVTKIDPSQGQTIPAVDPHEEFAHVQIQISNKMSGFFSDFVTTDTQNPKEIMMCYTPESLPVLNSLAKNFAVSDAYFSSIPTQTNCNRAFSLTGNSIGAYHYFGNKRTAMVDNHWQVDGFGAPYEFTEKTVWNVLNDKGHSSKEDWMVYYGQTWPGTEFNKFCFTQDLLWPHMQDQRDHFADLSEFFDKASNGSLPTFSFLEPIWYEQLVEHGVTIGHNGNDYHPPGNVCTGEAFLYKIYEALSTSPNWENTLLIINFDEHGGTFDHVQPPSNVAAPWKNIDDGTLPPDDNVANFPFTSLGVRVPLILVSPLIEEKTVFRSNISVPFDHTSVIATILSHFDIPRNEWGLGSRTANAPEFGNVVTLDIANARKNITVTPPLGPCTTPPDLAVNDLQTMIMHRSLARAAEKHNYPNSAFNDLVQNHFENVQTMSQLNEKAAIILKEITNS
jgi:phospholipase C